MWRIKSSQQQFLLVTDKEYYYSEKDVKRSAHVSAVCTTTSLDSCKKRFWLFTILNEFGAGSRTSKGHSEHSGQAPDVPQKNRLVALQC
ncbi:Hypothetical predicted protein [Marmota monax]|uniref:Uncharacterized protein n=1 Tax=Marmota monax TaxID=9995 RepID=A0A5E4CB23_MARMO|nr:hypothetical protein GHT09_013761 [Marmota monax]VTJ79038.1 Hypothetical predicted protein [Marmota monax]